MYLEDDHCNDYFYLKQYWELYNSWKWSIQPKFNIEIGQYVDVYDKVNTWCSAKIIKIVIFPNHNNTVFEKKMKVRFLGWDDGFNETVSIEKIKPFGSRTLNPYNKYESLKNIKEKIWVLFKRQYNNRYVYAKLKVVEINTNNIIVKVDELYVKITKKNIETLIKVSTNANALIFKNKHYDLYSRNFKF
jgi:hypothetical protein